MVMITIVIVFFKSYLCYYIIVFHSGLLLFILTIKYISTLL